MGTVLIQNNSQRPIQNYVPVGGAIQIHQRHSTSVLLTPVGHSF